MIEDQNMTNCKPISVTYNAFSQIPASKLYATLNNQSILITSNQRLARFRLQAFEKQQLKLGKTAWETPQVLPWSTWLRQQWTDANIGLWLNKQQETLLWQTCITQDPQVHVLNPKALSKQAMDARQILADFHIDPSCLQYAGEEHLALWRWQQNIQEKTEHYLAFQILEALQQTQVTGSQTHIVLDGFDSFSPAQVRYLEHLQQQGCSINTVTNDQPKAVISLFKYQDEEVEIRQVCQQIRKYNVQHPKHTIAVLIPNLERIAPTIRQIFSEELAPSLSLESNADEQGAYFNISLGSPLANQPLIQTALHFLRLTQQYSLDFQGISQFLLNPYVQGYNEEANQRTAFDAFLRQQNQYNLNTEQLLNLCQESDVDLSHLIHTLECILQQQQTLKNAPHKQLLSQWLSLSEPFLDSIFWNSQSFTLPYEIAQHENWKTLISSLPALDDFCGFITWSEALSHIQEHAFEHVFRPAPGLANIQIMGLLEAANLSFDHAFVLGMDDATWPPAAKPHPLIPFDIQTQYQTPHANSEREWLYAQSVWQHIQHIAPTLSVSYASLKGGQEVQASPFVKHITEQAGSNHDSSRYALDLQQHQASTSNIADTMLAITTDENIKGGTGIIKAQSACPFQAFARYRLRLRGLETPTLGLTAAEQGTLLHAALEYFWKHAKNSTTLLQYINQDSLDQHIQAAAAHAWSAIKRLVPQDIKTLETKRLQQLMQQWLHFESTREPFTVTGFEFEQTVTLGTSSTLVLHTKIDRSDKTASGHHIIIDYKTGLVSANKALGDRPDEPQLPIYYMASQASNSQVDVLTFAQVRNGEVKFEGFSQDADILPKLKAYKPRNDQPEDWQALTEHWKDTLNNLADEFMAGEAQVSPKNAQACTYCEFDGLCRINE